MNEVSLTQFNRLVSELLRGTLNRNCFRPWEIELLLEIENCDLRPSARRDLLRRYQKAVRRHFENCTGPPPKLSEYLQSLRVRKARNGSEPGLQPDDPLPELS
ncbi:MAG: hypothetical protein HY822_18280 [Acidobacteria bacterium]|nr:hypothetical protein [Acidobacteriota bacterium]